MEVGIAAREARRSRPLRQPPPPALPSPPAPGVANSTTACRRRGGVPARFGRVGCLIRRTCGKGVHLLPAGSETINAAQILAEWGDCRDPYDGRRRGRPRRTGAGDPLLRQISRRQLPRGMYLTPAGRCHHYRRQQSARKPLGRRYLPDAPVPAARITSTQSGFLLEPCWGLSGAASAPALPTTVRFTTARRNTSPRRKRPEFAAKGGYRGCDGTTGLPGAWDRACLAP